MTLATKVIQGNYFKDLLDQPAALAQTLKCLQGQLETRAKLRDLEPGRFRRIILTGMGSSLHALHPLNGQLIAQGYTSLLAETSELIHYMRGLLLEDSLVVAVSQSGASAETVRLLELNQGCTPVIGVTNTPDSPLARQATIPLFMDAGPEFTVSCKTLLATLLALSWLGDLLCKKAPSFPEAAIDGVEQYLRNWKSHVNELCPILDGIRQIFLAGRGASLAAVGSGGLTIKESTHHMAEGMSSAAFRHGPLEILDETTFVLIFAGDRRTAELNRKLARDVEAAGGKAALAGEDVAPGVFRLPVASDCARPLLETLPVQMITLALAALDGREAGSFVRATKVTTTE